VKGQQGRESLLPRDGCSAAQVRLRFTPLQISSTDDPCGGNDARRNMTSNFEALELALTGYI
jgi:hypothetical protein